MYILLIFFIYSVIKLRGDDFFSFIYITWIVILVWLSDIGCYICGKLIGGIKLSKYSPNKTISGLIGSIVFSQLSIVILILYIPNLDINFNLIILQFVICLISILGDIFFSILKRLNNIKDYSQFIPGHGGVLDRIDGLIFVIIFYYLFTLIYAK